MHSFPRLSASSTGSGRRNLGMGRHWHFFSAIFWIVSNAMYVVLLLGTGEWRRVVPTSWGLFHEAGHDAWTYLHSHAAAAEHITIPYDQ